MAAGLRNEPGFDVMAKDRDGVLEGSKALVVGIASERSIANACANAFRELGAELAITYVKENSKPYVEPIARRLDARILTRK